MKKKWDVLGYAALGMSIVGTASAEYHLAVVAGWGAVSFALPGCLDVYAIRAMRAHRDMAAVLIALIIVNSVSHLIAVGLLDPSVWVVIGVSSIAPAVLWRVHALRDEEPAAEAEPMDDHFRTAAELTGTAAKFAEVPTEPDLVPVTLERVPEAGRERGTNSTVLTFGPLVPVAELLAGTGRDQAPSLPFAGTEGSPEQSEPDPVVPEPEPEPDEHEPEPPAGSAGVPAERIETAREWLAAEPELTGTEIGRRLGTSDSYGRRVKKIALALETTP